MSQTSTTTRPTGTRIARNTSAAVVAGIAAWSSYLHMSAVALHFGERAEIAYVLPLSVDGMLIVSTIAMADDKRSGRSVRLSARVAFVIGVAASITANVVAAHPSVGARIVAGWPALALLLVVEILSRGSKTVGTPGTPVPPESHPVPVRQETHPVAAVTAPTLPQAPTSPAPYGPAVRGHLGRPRMPLLSAPTTD